MYTKTFFYLILLIFFTGSCSLLKQNQSRNGEYYFIQITDIQFGMYTKNKDFTKETTNYEKAVAAINKLKPAFVVSTGDLVNDFGDSLQVLEYKRISSKIDKTIILYNTPGNHDVENTPTLKSVKKYRKWFGQDYFSFNYKKTIGIVLNSVLLKDTTAIPTEYSEQYKWLKETLANAYQKQLNILVFMHHPLFLNYPDENDQYFNIPKAVRKKYLDLFAKYKVHYVFAGHLHKNNISKADGIEMITNAPVGKPLGKDSSGLRIVLVKKDKIVHRYFKLDSIPGKLSDIK